MDRGHLPAGPCTLKIILYFQYCNVSRLVLNHGATNTPDFLLTALMDVSRIRSLCPYMPNGSILFLLLLPPIGGIIDEGDNEGKQNIL